MIRFKFFIIFVAIVLLAISVTAALTNGFTNADPFGWLEDLNSGDINISGDMSSGITDENGENLESGVLQSMPSQLNFSSQAFAMAQESGESYIEVMLQATVLPEDATNKAVDWSVIWADGSGSSDLSEYSDSSDLSEYLTVTPESDGSTIASVRCYKAFDRQIILTVTTREGGFSDNCIISYDTGYVSALKLTTDAPIVDGIYKLKVGQTYSFNLSLIGHLGEDVNRSMNLSVSNSTSSYVPICTATFVSKRIGDSYWDLDSIDVVTLKQLSNDCFSFSLSDKVLTVTVLQSLTLRYSSSSSNEQRDVFYEGRPIISISSSIDSTVSDYIEQNEKAFESALFELYVKDSISGYSISIPFITE